MCMFHQRGSKANNQSQASILPNALMIFMMMTTAMIIGLPETQQSKDYVLVFLQ